MTEIERPAEPAHLISMALRPIEDSNGWKHTLRDRLMQRHNLTAGAHSKTSQNETRLGFPEPCVYWYLMAVDPDYREGIILSVVTEEGDRPRLSPFDTGGVASGHVVWRPASMKADEMVRLNTFAWSPGATSFVDWVRSAFTRVHDYWNRTTLIRPTACYVDAIDLTACEDARSWTWEARLERSAATLSSAVSKTRLVMRSELYEAFMTWLPDHPGPATSDAELVELGRWLQENTLQTSDGLSMSAQLFEGVVATW